MDQLYHSAWSAVGLLIIYFSRGLGAFWWLLHSFGLVFPIQVRVALACASLPVIYMMEIPSAAIESAIKGDAIALTLIGSAEFMIGVMVTLPLVAMCWAAQSLGELIDIKLGANNSAVFGALPDTPEGPTQQFMVQLFCVVVVAAGGLQATMTSLWSSYRFLKVGDYQGFNLDSLIELASVLISWQSSVIWHVLGVFFILFTLADIVVSWSGKKISSLSPSQLTNPFNGLVYVVVLSILLSRTDYFQSITLTALDRMGDLHWLKLVFKND